jgi:hypothetical protein
MILVKPRWPSLRQPTTLPLARLVDAIGVEGVVESALPLLNHRRTLIHRMMFDRRRRCLCRCRSRWPSRRRPWWSVQGFNRVSTRVSTGILTGEPPRRLLFFGCSAARLHRTNTIRDVFRLRTHGMSTMAVACESADVDDQFVPNSADLDDLLSSRGTSVLVKGSSDLGDTGSTSGLVRPVFVSQLFFFLRE